MRKLLLIVLVFSAGLAKAQQLAQWTQYVNNQYGMNPAAIDRKDCIEARLGQRMQWVGFAGAPITTFFSANGFIPTNSAIRKGKHALGVYVERDDAGFISRKSVNVSYSYHKMMGRNLWMGMGIFAGVMQYGFNSPNLNINTVPDYAVQQSASVLLYPDLSPGIWLSSKKMYAGLSIKSIVGNKLVKAHGLKNRLTRHLYGTAGYYVTSNDKKHVSSPSVCIRFTPMGPPSVDLNYMWQYRNRFVLGAGYRVGEAVNAMVRLNLIRSLWVGYSYDFPLNKIKYASIQTHEIIVGLRLCKGKEYKEATSICPAYSMVDEKEDGAL